MTDTPQPVVRSKSYPGLVIAPIMCFAIALMCVAVGYSVGWPRGLIMGIPILFGFGSGIYMLANNISKGWGWHGQK